MLFMPTDEVLLALAQIAVSIIGFSGVVVALGRAERERWSASESLRLRTLVEPSMVVLLGSLLPFLIRLLYPLWISIHNFYFLLFGRSFQLTDHSAD